MKRLESLLIVALFSFCLGALLALSVKYPLDVTSIPKYQSYCPGSTVGRIKIGLSGDIYEVKCANGITHKVD